MESNATICIIFIVLLGCYCILTSFYCFKRTHKVCTFWYDFLLLLVLLILSFIADIFATNQKSFFLENDNSFVLWIHLILFSGLFWMNSFTGIKYIFEVNKLIRIPPKCFETTELSLAYLKQGINKYLSKIHFIFLAIVFILQILSTLFGLFLCFPQLKYKEYYYFGLQTSFFLISFTILFIAKRKYSILLNHPFFSNNLLIEKQFEKTKEQILLLIEHLINKNLCDIFINIPFIVEYYLNFDLSILLYYKIIYFVYIIFYGSLLLTIDNHNNISIPKIINYCYLFPAFSFNILSSRKHIQIYNNDIINFEEDEFKTINTNSLGFDPMSIVTENENYKTDKENIPCTYFIIFKLFYLYFKKNEKVYLETEKLVEDNGIPFRNFMKKETKSSKTSKTFLTSSNISDTIFRISRISITNKERIISSVKYTMNNIMNSMDEKHLKDEFIKYILKDSYDYNKITGPEFKIEALFMEDFFELFPFYQININDVMRSLDIAENRELFTLFYDLKCEKKQFNSYFTKDLFLSFEIYDQQFIPFNTIRTFVNSYKTYILEKLKSFSFTFLPMIIGIFNVTYLSYSKIVILYKNPIAFSYFLKSNCWINYCYNKVNTLIRKSATLNEVADLDEIEVKNNIFLGEDDYNETIKTLKEDMKFLKSQQFELNFFLNLFVLNESKKNKKDVDFLLLTNEKNDNVIAQKDNDELIDVIKNSSFFTESFDYLAKQFKKYYNSDVVSLIEKLYENSVVDNKYVFKIFFSELFKSSNQPKQGNNELLTTEKMNLDNKEFCKIIKAKILKTLSKDDNSFLSDYS